MAYSSQPHGNVGWASTLFFDTWNSRMGDARSWKVLALCVDRWFCSRDLRILWIKGYRSAHFWVPSFDSVSIFTSRMDAWLGWSDLGWNFSFISTVFGILDKC